MRHFEIRSEDYHRPELVRVILGGEFDLTAHDALLSTLRTVATDPPPQRIEVDLHAVRLLDCRSIGMIVAAGQDVEQSGGRLYLTRAHGNPARMLALTGLACGRLGFVAPLAN